MSNDPRLTDIQVKKLVKEVNDLGTIAQGDLGLDYAWLDDVTVNDWAVSALDQPIASPPILISHT